MGTGGSNSFRDEYNWDTLGLRPVIQGQALPIDTETTAAHSIIPGSGWIAAVGPHGQVDLQNVNVTRTSTRTSTRTRTNEAR
jgi:hypothetical protein